MANNIGARVGHLLQDCPFLYIDDVEGNPPAKAGSQTPIDCMEKTLEKVLQDVASHLLAAIPERWDQGELRLSFSNDGERSSCKHEIFNTKCPKDVVMATDDLMCVTRVLGLWFAEIHGSLKTATFRVSQDNDGRWRFAADFEYQ